jgi:hypothetical protein
MTLSLLSPFAASSLSERRGGENDAARIPCRAAHTISRPIDGGYNTLMFMVMGAVLGAML